MSGIKKKIKANKKRSGIKSKFMPRPPEPPEVIEARWKKKKDRIHELANNVSRLRLNITRDLESDNERTALIALIIALMDRTGERIGNGDSIKDGHYGVTYFEKRHAKVRGNEVKLDYIGKSGVPHNPMFSSDKISKALKIAIRNSPSKYIFETSDGLKIHQHMVNEYLHSFNITGKDLRGYFINRAMTERLNSLSIPETEKERKKLFNKTCKQIATKIGHGAGTCKKHYIVPELPEQYITHGKIIDLKSQKYYKGGGEVEKRKELAYKIMEGGSELSPQEADFANLEKNRIIVPHKITKDELQSIISGTRKVANGDTIQTAPNYIRREKGTSSINKSPHYSNWKYENVPLRYPEEENTGQAISKLGEMNIIKRRETLAAMNIIQRREFLEKQKRS